jgi:deazaflavin-dependent oxidoreductase (nitroreductase family)
MGVHTHLYRLTGGRLGHTIPGVGGKMLLLDHVGAKSGTRRTSPLLYVKDGDDLVVVASKGGFPKHPAWYHNLMANSDTTVQVGTEKRRVHARTASPEERERLWPLVVARYHGYADYQARSKGREIPLVVLEPRK